MIHRTPSLDRLDDRMGRSLRHSMHYCQDSSSSDEEDMTGIVSPVSAGKGRHVYLYACRPLSIARIGMTIFTFTYHSSSQDSK